jgi:hypothetical protein
VRHSPTSRRSDDSLYSASASPRAKLKSALLQRSSRTEETFAAFSFDQTLKFKGRRKPFLHTTW